jgi:hypothetical protein
MTRQQPIWPRTTGTSLLLVPLSHRAEDWVQADAVLRSAVGHLGIAVARGVSHCPPYVRAGAEVALGALAKDVLVFACPADIGVFESAPLVTAAESGSNLAEVADFFRRASDTALRMAPKIAWVVAHDWSVGARVRWDAGDVELLVRFATSPGAWRTQFLVPPRRELQESDEWPFWFEVSPK